jgi:hypothetical protein
MALAKTKTDDVGIDRRLSTTHVNKSFSLLPVFTTPGHSGCRDIVFYARSVFADLRNLFHLFVLVERTRRAIPTRFLKRSLRESCSDYSAL